MSKLPKLFNCTKKLLDSSGYSLHNVLYLKPLYFFQAVKFFVAAYQCGFEVQGQCGGMSIRIREFVSGFEGRCFKSHLNIRLYNDEGQLHKFFPYFICI